MLCSNWSKATSARLLRNTRKISFTKAVLFCNMNDQKPPDKQNGTLEEMGILDTKTTKRTSLTSIAESILLDADPDCIAPDLQDMMLTDVTSEKLHSEISAELETEYLSLATTNQSSPLRGYITGVNNRLMLNIVTRRVSRRDIDPEYPAFNVIFVCDTGSPSTFLCAEAMRVLLGPSGSDFLPQLLPVQLADFPLPVKAHLSPSTSHFHDANVIGMDVLAQVKTTVSGKNFSFEISTMHDENA